MILFALFLAAASVGHPQPRARRPMADSVIKDSIYALAVDPMTHPNDRVVVLLDEGIYRLEADGRVLRTTRQVIQILKPEGAMPYREQRLSYDPSFEKLTVNWMRVVKPDGQVVMDHPLQTQESDVPAPMGTPMYTGTKVIRMSLSGLDAGTIFDYSRTTEVFNPFLRGDFYVDWRVTMSSPVVRSHMVVDVPANITPRIVEKRLAFKRTEQVVGGRKLYTWATTNVVPPKLEPFTPDSASPLSRIIVGAPFGWSAIGKWYSGLVRPAYTITPDVAAKIAKVVAGSRTLDDSIRAVHKWVAQDIRYVAIELGRGGYVPRDPETVVRTGFGDCKDKTMLFLAALKAMGVTGYPVLLNLFGSVQPETPAIEQFNHVIAAVKKGNSYVFSDLTAGSFPYGVLPGVEVGKFAVMVKENNGDELRLPSNAESSSFSSERIVGELTDSGTFNGRMEQTVKGSEAAFMREFFATSMDSARRAAVARMVASSYFKGSDGDSLQVSDARDLSSPARISVLIKNGKAVSKAGNVLLFTNPIRPLASFAAAASALERQPKRTLPIDMSSVVNAGVTARELRITLPVGWTATLPKNVSVTGPLGSYEERYSQNGRELSISRNLNGTPSVLPADQAAAVISWLKAVGNDNAEVIVLQKQ